jgi:elongation factor P
MADVVDTNQFRNGMHIKFDNHIWRIVWFQHHKPGKGGAVMRTKLRNLDTGAVVDKTFRAGEKFPRILTETRNGQFLYQDGDGYNFMDPETFEQIVLDAKTVGDDGIFLQEGVVIQMLYVDGNPSGLQLPTTVELTVTETEPAVRGDTVGNVMKPATLENGAVISVPSFVAEGDKLKIDTRDASYVSRV